MLLLPLNHAQFNTFYQYHSLLSISLYHLFLIPTITYPFFCHQDSKLQSQYIKVLDQYYYICVVLDLFSRRILSYSISDSINTALTLAAFDDAFQSRNSPQDLMFHSDQGAQYTSYIFRAHLKELHIKQSFSTPGTPYDNSVCESFFHTLKKEALYHHLYGTPQELQAVLDEYINFYNSQRPHRKLNMKTPNQYESAFYSGCL